MPTFDPRAVADASFILSVSPVGQLDAVILAWRTPSGEAAKVQVAFGVPQQMLPSQGTPLTAARDFLGVFVGRVSDLGFAAVPALRSALDQLNEQIVAYQRASLDVTNANGNRWPSPSPDTIAQSWRVVLRSYINAWMTARTLATNVGNPASQSTGQVPNATNMLQNASMPSAGMRSMFMSGTPEMIAQVTGTMRVGTSPSPSSGMSPASYAGDAAMTASSTSNAAGSPISVATPALVAGSVEPPSSNNTLYYVGVGAGLLLLAALLFRGSK